MVMLHSTIVASPPLVPGSLSCYTQARVSEAYCLGPCRELLLNSNEDVSFIGFLGVSAVSGLFPIFITFPYFGVAFYALHPYIHKQCAPVACWRGSRPGCGILCHSLLPGYHWKNGLPECFDFCFNSLTLPCVQSPCSATSKKPYSHRPILPYLDLEAWKIG